LDKISANEEFMISKVSTGKISQSVPLKFHILLDRSNETKISASFLELPNCQVEASTQEEAIEKLNEILNIRLEKLEIIPVEIEWQPPRTILTSLRLQKV
jgi:predicted RNase H-like HicB family nuclease